ncbi:hypothetical protein FISHEDRAFT_62376 [Fistulina hepatica ATCC 64428]|nr:hypothetical protein FISHEDRAFT_62376 [Fistulina hepatica ATCC 64428]
MSMKNIGPRLKKRLDSWRKIKTPATQFSQYGFMDKYLNKVFHQDYWVLKPQGLIRQEFESATDLVLPPDGAEVDPDASFLTVDSYGGVVYRDDKLYPDFVLAQFADDVRSEVDTIYLILEIFSDEPTDSETRLDSRRSRADMALGGYMELIADERCDREHFVGIAMVGYYVSIWTWDPKRNVFSSTGSWHSIFGRKFQNTLDRLAALKYKPRKLGPVEEEEDEEEAEDEQEDVLDETEDEEDH